MHLLLAILTAAVLCWLGFPLIPWPGWMEFCCIWMPVSCREAAQVLFHHCCARCTTLAAYLSQGTVSKSHMTSSCHYMCSYTLLLTLYKITETNKENVFRKFTNDFGLYRTQPSKYQAQK